MNTYIDIHVIQTVPPSNLNRDDTGSPKSAFYGGARRARVSSQAWKRAARMAFADHIGREHLGHRTTRVVELIADEIESRGEDVDAVKLAKAVADAIGLKAKAPRQAKAADDSEPLPRTEYLVFVSPEQVRQLADTALDQPLDKKRAKAVMQSGNSIDLALFGRMVADDANLNVDASVQVAHALSTHAVQNEFDYFTAVDDRNPEDETGAGMIGTIEFNSATLYRYATINVDGLVHNLGERQAAATAAKVFVSSFLTCMPTGKQNTFANRTAPDLVLITVRRDQPLNLAGAFEDPIRPTSTSSISAQSATRLIQRFEFLQRGLAPLDDDNAAGSPGASWLWIGSPEIDSSVATANTERVVRLGELGRLVEAAVVASDS